MKKRKENRKLKQYTHTIPVILIVFALITGTALIGAFLGQGDQVMPDYASQDKSVDLPILVYTENSDETDEIGRHGKIIDHYGRNTLLTVEEQDIEYMKENYEVDMLEERTKLHIKGHEFDTNEGLPELNSNLKIEEYEEGREGLYIVNFIAPINPEWREKIEDTGAKVINYQPNYAYEVVMTPEQADDIEKFEFVDWVGIYQPEFKLHPQLDEALDENMPVDVRLRPGYEQTTITILESRLDVLGSEDLHGNGFRLTVDVDSKEKLEELAMMNEVYYISPYLEPELHGEMDIQQLGGGLWFMDDEYEDRDDLTPPPREGDPQEPYRKHGDYGAYINQVGYSGEDITVAVADTGLGDGTVGDAGVEDFTGRVIGGYGFGEDEDNWQDGHYHGTACTGLIAGDTYHGTGDTWDEFEDGDMEYYMGQGLAYESDIFGTKIFDDGGAFIAEEYYPVVEEPAQRSDAYVHSNSWGAGTMGEYSNADEIFDQAVRDANRDTDENRPMVITVSAGNDGGRGGYEQETGSPGNAKNVITVGGNQPYNPGLGYENPENMYGSSSRGWTEDNRVKPDLIAPSEAVLSQNTPLGGGGYVAASGTSFGNPLVAGAATIVVDWYEENFEETPSPAMVKSILINTANELDSEGGDTRGPIPNQDEGWGVPDLSKLEYPPGNEAMSEFTLIDQEDPLQTGDVEEFQISNPPDHEDEPFKITLAWTDENAQAGDSEGGTPTLKNNLDLEVISPDGDVYRGNAFDETGDGKSDTGFSYPHTDAMEDFDHDDDGWDDVNNVQNVYINPDDAEIGTYTVRIKGTNVPADANNDGEANQDYALTANVPHITEDGVFSMDHHRYAEEDTVDFMVMDLDMENQNTVDIEVISRGNEGTVEDMLDDVTLRGDRTGFVSGSLDISPEYEDDDEGLYVEHGFEIEAIYYDQSMEENKSRFAIVDGEAPALASDVQVEWHYEDNDDNLITWEASDDDELEEFDGYRIYRAKSLDAEPDEWKHVETVEPGTEEYIDEGIGESEYKRHWYDVGVIDDVGNSARTYDPDIEPPAVRLDNPEGDVIWTSSKEEEIEWYAASGGVDANITVEYSTDSGNTWENIVEKGIDQGEGSYTWTIPEVEGIQPGSLIRISISDVHEESQSFSEELVSEQEGLGDTPWPQMGHDQRRTGRSSINTTHNEGVKHWTFETDGSILSNPAIASDGTIYIGSRDGNLYAVNPNGTEKWVYETDGSIQKSSPAIADDGTIYIGSDDTNLHAVHPNGTEKWIFDHPRDTLYNAPNIGDDGTIYIGSYDEHLYAVNPNGTEKWRWDSGDFRGGGPVASSPAIGEDPETGEERIYIGTNEPEYSIYALDAEDGSQIWEKYGWGWTLSPPTVAKDGTIYAGTAVGGDGELFAMNPDGREKWSFSVDDDIYGSPLIAEDGTIYVGSYDNNIYAVDPDDGSEKWSFEADSEIRRGGAIGGEGRIYYGSLDGSFYALEPEEGSEIWRYDVGAPVYTGPAICEEGLIYFGAHDNNVHALGSAIETPSQVSKPEIIHTADSQVQIDWERPNEIPSDDSISSYNIYRDGEKIDQAEGAENTTYLDTDLENWREYTYQISAVNDIGEGELSPSVTAEPKPHIPESPEGGDISDYIIITEYEPLEIYEITSPSEGDTWYGNTEEEIEWTIFEGDGELTHLKLEYSIDGGDTWEFIDEIDYPESEGEYEWNVPLDQSDESMIRIYVEDEYALYSEDKSDKFEMIVSEPPENLSVDYVSVEEVVQFRDKLESDEPGEGYQTGENPEGLNEWAVRDNGASVGEYSWDFGDGDYEGVDGGGLSWLVSPEIELPEDSIETELTFQHWRDFDYLYEGGNLRISQDGENWELIEPEEGYPGVISEEFDNPLAGEPAWTESEDWEKVTFDLDEYIGETVQFNWTAGVDHWEGDEEGWRIDDIEIAIERPFEEEADNEDNRLFWDASPDDGAGEDNVIEYNIYRSDTQDELGDYIDSVEAKGLEEYRYFDEGAGTADSTTWWYTVRAVSDGENEEEFGDSAQEPIAPYPPAMLEPDHGEALYVGQGESVNLSFKATHACSDTLMDIDFYDAKTDQFIGEVTDVHPNEYASVEWDLSTGDFEEGKYSWYVTIDDSEHILEPDEFDFLVDRTDPEVEITKPESREILEDSEILVSWEGHDKMSGVDYYEVRRGDVLDWNKVSDVTEFTIEDVEDGYHTIFVRATDRAGNQAVDTVDFSVNTEGRVVEIISPERNSVFGEDEVRVEWNRYYTHMDIENYEIRLKDGTWIDVGKSQSYTLTDLEEGINVIEVRATDQAGNRFVESKRVLHDATEPDVNIFSPEEGKVLEQNWADLKWSGEDDHSIIDEYKIRLNNQPWIEYDGRGKTLFHDTLESGDPKEGYETGVDPDPEGRSEWDVRDVGGSVGEYSWDFGDGQYEKPGEGGYVSWLESPGIYIPFGLEEPILNFNHRMWFLEIEDEFLDGGNMKISTDGETWELIEPVEGYPGEIATEKNNPLGGEPGWGGSRYIWEEVTFELDDYIGEEVYFRWEAGIEDVAAQRETGWQIDDIKVYDLTEENEHTNHEEFSHNFTNLHDGEHTVDVRAIDSAGNQYTETVNFVIDSPEARVNILSPKDGVESLTYEEDFLIYGETDSASTVYIDGVKVEVGDNGIFEYETILQEGQNIFRIDVEYKGALTEIDVYAFYLPQIPELWEEIEELRSQVDQLSEDMDDLEEQIETLQIQLNELELELIELKAQTRVMETENEEIQAQIEELESQIESLQEELEETEKEMKNDGDTDDEWWEIPGFTAGFLIFSMIISMGIYHTKRKRKEDS